MAAWVAQHRADVDLAVLIEPEFTISRGLGIAVSKLVMYLFRIMPNFMMHLVRPFTGALQRVGFSVFDAASPGSLLHSRSW